MANLASSHDLDTRRRSPLRTVLMRIRSFLRGESGLPSLRQSLEEMIEEDENSVHELRDEERHMLLNILNFGELRVEDVMVPRADIVGVDVNTSLEDLVRIFREAAHSRLPVFRDTLDDPIGMVHIKDVIGLIGSADGAGDPHPIAKLKREVLFVPPSMPVVDLFLKMQATRIHMALVIDEYGGTDGLVTIEDLVEEIVGEIEDEHDVNESPTLRPLPAGGFEADARVPIEDLEKVVGIDLLPDERDEDIDTLGGLVFSLVGRVPQRGELISHPFGLDFEVVDADPRRIKRLRIFLTRDDAEDTLSDVAPAEK